MINDQLDKNTNEDINHFENLATELTLSIFKFLGNNDFPNTSLVCKNFYSLNSEPITLYWRMTQEPDLKRIQKLNHFMTDSHFKAKAKMLMQERSISLLKESTNMSREAYLLQEQTNVPDECNQIERSRLINDIELFNASNLLEYLQSFCDCLKNAFLDEDPVNVYGLSSQLTYHFYNNFVHFAFLVPEYVGENKKDMQIEIAKMSLEYFNLLLKSINQGYQNHYSFDKLDETLTQTPEVPDQNQLVEYINKKLNETESFLNKNDLCSQFKSLKLT